jgi:hypothetical protein
MIGTRQFIGLSFLPGIGRKRRPSLHFIFSGMQLEVAGDRGVALPCPRMLATLHGEFFEGPKLLAAYLPTFFHSRPQRLPSARN